MIIVVGLDGSRGVGGVEDRGRGVGRSGGEGRRTEEREERGNVIWERFADVVVVVVVVLQVLCSMIEHSEVFMSLFCFEVFRCALLKSG